MKKYNANAYKQAYVITDFLVEIGEIVIPETLIDTIESRMNKDYYFDLNDIKKTEIMEDTEKILTQVYFECMVNEIEKNKIDKLSNQLKELIVGKEEKNIEQSLLTTSLDGLKFFEKIRVKLNKLSATFGKAY